MPFFGQVWLWSLAGFLVGALLCWALVARPARRRVTELEDSLAEARGRRPEPVAAAYEPEHRAPAFDDYDAYSADYPPRDEHPSFGEDSPDDELSAPAEAAPEPQEPPAVAPVESTQLMATPPVAPHPPVEAPPEVEPEWYPVAERFDVSRLDAADSPADEHLVDDLTDDAPDDAETPADEPGTIFTQHTTPISGSLIRRIDDDASLVDDLDDGDDIDPHRGHFAAALTPDDEEEYAREHPLAEQPSDAEEEPVTRYLPAVPAEQPRAEDSPEPEPEPEPLPKRGALPKRTPGSESRRPPVGESTTFAAFDQDRSRHSLDAEPDERTTHLAASAPQNRDATGLFAPPSAQPEPDAGLFAPAQESRSRHETEPTMFAPSPAQESRSRHEAEPTLFSPAARPEPETSRPEPEPTVFSPAARPEAETSRPEPEPTVFAPSVPEPVDEPAAPAARAPQATGLLPKRVPKKPGDRFPFGVQTSTPDPVPATPAPSPSSSSSHSAPAAEPEPERSRSLFEPVRPADEAPAAKAPLPAQARARRGSGRPSQVLPGGVDTFVPPGPFGPGSAMPLPGGNSPSSEYRVKASVTALRYCSPESPKFDRTVAEVWFRTVADAERVGFRPLP